ncbi:LacI family DNA-binding transcriptional regulator [Sphaerisporangium sp. TRM90804]|uniref:LacI family DNA-binding transcriptional regulator n=1 Tax=Sphaerisporangium sp. TRM90804 TaxID=3031113 RepID=UPI002448768A|nr:LacI family DNA-binding transcriptional regulator [Sphaerisporangium sp. TRM90804]MDH2427123.1 LacI family DNA-binding transcriptional regulator [Sphaerisporangium sp. TRM90804]
MDERADAQAGGVTIYEVAQRAGVSIATVSRTLRGTGPVAGATREKVLRAVEELRFTPSRAGVSLAEGRHAANGIVFPNLSGPYFAEVLIGYEEVTSELGRSVVILSTKGREPTPRGTDAIRDAVRELAGRVDGLVVFGSTVPGDVVEELVASRLPLVLISHAPMPGAVTLRSENTASARALAHHLLGHGHAEFAFLGAPYATGDDVDLRWQGVREVLGDAVQPVLTAEYTVESGYQAALRLLRGAGRPRAVICSDDEVALGTILAAEELGLSVPHDVAVTGWDDIMAARHARPALTTVRQPMRELGARAARALDALIAGLGVEDAHRTLDTELIVRGSCGPHPPGGH